MTDQEYIRHLQSKNAKQRAAIAAIEKSFQRKVDIAVHRSQRAEANDPDSVRGMRSRMVWLLENNNRLLAKLDRIEAAMNAPRDEKLRHEIRGIIRDEA